METTDRRYQAYLAILKEELIPAMGCTEPIAIAYAAAKAREILGTLPQRVSIEVSRNIIKNVKSVVVPNTGNLKGIEAAAAAGMTVGKANKVLEVISVVDDAGRKQIKDFLNNKEINVSESNSELTFDLTVTVFSGNSQASVQISHYHTNIVLIKKNNTVLYTNQDCNEIETIPLTDRTIMNIRDILDFAASVEIKEIETLLQNQIDYNMAIATEGLKNNWGANIGSVLIDSWGNDVKVRAKALAAAASDARMSGCSLPVMIVSGSGNQGITASVPVCFHSICVFDHRD